jgi:hypothetical protein
MKTIWIILISFVVTASIVGGGTYYLVNAQANKDKDALQVQITDLNKKIINTEKSLAEVQTATTATQNTTTSTVITPVASVSTAGWKTFTNKTYAFSFEYPAADVVNGNSSDSDSNVYVRTDDEYWLYGVTVTPNSASQTLAQIAKQNFDKLSASISAYMTEEATNFRTIRS